MDLLNIPKNIETSTTFLSTHIGKDGSLSDLNLSKSCPSHYRKIIKFNTIINPKKKLTSPRNSSAPIFLDTFQPLKDTTLQDLTKWLQNNVISYLQHKSSWETGIYPERLLYLYGLKGVGRLSTVAYYCHQHKINLIYVNPNYNEEAMHADLFKTAKEYQPCIIYYDEATEMVNTPGRLAPFAAMFDVLLDVSQHDVWVFLAGENDLVQLPFTLSYMLERYGSVVYTPVGTDSAYRYKVIEGMLRGLVGSSTYPYQYLDDVNGRKLTPMDWREFLSRFNLACNYCTYRDIWRFIVKVFRTFRQTIDHRADAEEQASAMSTPKISRTAYPSLSHFEAEYNILPTRTDNNCSDVRILVAHRDVVSDSTMMISTWNLYHQSHPSAGDFVLPSSISFDDDDDEGYTCPSSPTPTLFLQHSQRVPDSPVDEFAVNPLRFSKPPEPAPYPVSTGKTTAELKKPSINSRQSTPASYPTTPVPLATPIRTKEWDPSAPVFQRSQTIEKRVVYYSSEEEEEEESPKRARVF